VAEPSETLLAWAGDDRVTLAIVFTDIVSSTALGVERGDEHMKEVRRAHFARSAALIEQYRGREIKTIGDSVMVAFRSIGAALDYAYALHVDPGHAVLRVRAGLHIGSVDIVGNDIFGTEVAFAARVARRRMIAKVIRRPSWAAAWRYAAGSVLTPQTSAPVSTSASARSSACSSIRC